MLSVRKRIAKSLLVSVALLSTLTAVGHSKIHASRINNNARITRQAPATKTSSSATPRTYPLYNIKPTEHVRRHHVRYHLSRRRVIRTRHAVKPSVQQTPRVSVRQNVRPVRKIRKAHRIRKIRKSRKASNRIRLASISHAKSNQPMGRPVPGYIHYLKAQRKARRIQRRSMRHGYRRMANIANTKLGDPYVWGGNGPTQFDCSGFTQYLYRNGMHKYIPRTAGAQYFYGRPVTEQQARKGDLVFFGSGTNNIEHVGMYIGNDNMVDAQLRGVVVEKIHAPWWNLVGFSHIR